MEHLPEELKRQYGSLGSMREMMATMKLNQSYRGIDGLKSRMATRNATHNTWRQMKGVQLFMHEINHRGNKNFAIGFG